MNLKLERFVLQDSIKVRTKQLLDAQTDTIAINYLQEITSVGELRKIRIFLRCQKREIGNNFTALAISISTIALVLPAIEKLFVNISYFYISLCVALAIGLGVGLFRDGIPFIHKTNEHNSKVDYLIWLIDEEINQRRL